MKDEDNTNYKNNVYVRIKLDLDELFDGLPPGTQLISCKLPSGKIINNEENEPLSQRVNEIARD